MPLPIQSLYTIDEAERFILTATGKTVTRAQILDWGTQGHYKLYLVTKECCIRIKGQPKSEVIAQNFEAELRLSSAEAAILGGSYFAKIKVLACWIHDNEINFVDVSTGRNDTYSLGTSSIRLLGAELAAFTASIAEPQQTTIATEIKSPALVEAETPMQRRARWLDWLGTGERGALQRVYERELQLNPKADRSYIGKEIEKAKTEKAETKRGGAICRQLVQDGKRKG